ncbi:MAG: hypothetical protein ACO1NO_08175 [Burkholderiaceae bacterium]
MASKTLQIKNIADQKKAPSILLVLFAIDGVSSVDFIPGPNQVNVVFDEDLTSPDEMLRALWSAGHPISAEKPRREATSCCGGCCS